MSQTWPRHEDHARETKIECMSLGEMTVNKGDKYVVDTSINNHFEVIGFWNSSPLNEQE